MYERFTLEGKPYPEMGREEEFEYITEKYSQVPQTFLLKTDLERRGVSFTEKARVALQNPSYEHTTQLLFQWHQMDKTQESYEHPLCLYFNDGTGFGIRLGAPESDPWEVDFIDGDFWLMKDAEPFEELSPLPRPLHYGKKTSSGVPMQYIAIAKPSDAFIFVPYRHCHYWNAQEQCRFCDMDYNTGLQMKLGRGFTTRSTPQDIYETTLEILKEEGRWRHLCITGGSDPREGYEREFEFYLSCAQAIQRAFKEVYDRDQIPLYLVLSPYPKEKLERFRDEAGVTRYAPNLEVWDPEKFPLQCPGKAKGLGREEWIKRMLQAVEVFGEGNVECAFVTGTIMAPPPYGYTEIEEAVRSDVEGIRFCIDHHIKPISYNWTVEPGSYFYKIGATQPPLEFYVKVDLERYRLLKEYDAKHGHAFPSGATDYRCCPWSACYDWERLL